VSIVDIKQFFPSDNLTGWGIKPFAMLFAPFEEVILMDGDAIFLQPPSVLFEDKGYQKESVLIFRDRTLFPNQSQPKWWLDENLPKPLSERVLQSRIYNLISNHEQESGVVVVNKRKKLMGLLATIRMMQGIEREYFYQTFWGDKESFWIGMEMADEAYSDMNPCAGVFGWGKIMNGTEVTCGHIAHFDRQGRPLWLNGGIVEDKLVNKEEINNFTHYSSANSEWNFTANCLIAKGTPINGSLSELMSQIIRLFFKDEILYTYLGVPNYS